MPALLKWCRMHADQQSVSGRHGSEIDNNQHCSSEHQTLPPNEISTDIQGSTNMLAEWTHTIELDRALLVLSVSELYRVLLFVSAVLMVMMLMIVMMASIFVSTPKWEHTHTSVAHLPLCCRNPNSMHRSFLSLQNQTPNSKPVPTFANIHLDQTVSVSSMHWLYDKARWVWWTARFWDAVGWWVGLTCQYWHHCCYRVQISAAADDWHKLPLCCSCVAIQGGASRLKRWRCDGLGVEARGGIFPFELLWPLIAPYKFVVYDTTWNWGLSTDKL